MAFNQNLAERIIVQLSGKKGITHRKMFGGLAFMLYGNMICGVIEDKLCVRVGPVNYEKSLQEKHVAPMDFTGRPIKSMVFVLPEGIKTKASLAKWIAIGLLFAESLPKKKKALKRKQHGF